jgi:T5SS/PEP-CTERM-associated repeat protein
MLVGQNDQQDNAPAPPYVAAAQLTVEQDAILEEADYANIANTIDSAGSVVISTGAQWDIGNTGTTGTPIGFLQVGRYGDGALTIDEAGTVAVGGGGTIVNNGTTETINYAVDIGHEAGATGTLTLQDGGSVLTTLGALIDGDSGSGNVTVEFGAQAFIDGTIGLGGGGSGPAGGDGVLDVIHDGTIEQGAGFALAVWAGSTLAVDASSAFDAGGSGVFVAGAVQIDAAGSGLRGDGVVEANIVNDGSIHATNSGTYSASTGGLLDITGSVTGSGTSYVSPGATLEIAGTIAASQNVIFQTQTGTPETLILGTPGSGLASALSGLQNHDRIELAGLAITGATFNSGTITVATTGSPYLLTDVSFASGANHSLVTGHDSTTGNDYIQVTCFAAGTRIATPDGPVPVERLRVGQRVETALGGGARDIIWIGRRRIDCRRHPNPSQVWPIRLRAGAFGANQPVRDLFLSPDHAVHFQGALIPVQYLVNGTTVQQMPVDGITYYHVELATHDVLFAEDLPVESYLDTDDRATFDNGSGPVRLHPDLTILRWEALGCAPLTVTGPKVAAARARLAAVAAAAA